MKKPSRQIREEISRLQEQLKAAETREAERIGRIALRAGLGEIEVEEEALLSAFEELAKRFRGDRCGSTGGKGDGKGTGGRGEKGARTGDDASERDGAAASPASPITTATTAPSITSTASAATVMVGAYAGDAGETRTHASDDVL
jgi:hypothetical protein